MENYSTYIKHNEHVLEVFEIFDYLCSTNKIQCLVEDFLLIEENFMHELGIFNLPNHKQTAFVNYNTIFDKLKMIQLQINDLPEELTGSSKSKFLLHPIKRSKYEAEDEAEIKAKYKNADVYGFTVKQIKYLFYDLIIFNKSEFYERPNIDYERMKDITELVFSDLALDELEWIMDMFIIIARELKLKRTIRLNHHINMMNVNGWTLKSTESTLAGITGGSQYGDYGYSVDVGVMLFWERGSKKSVDF